MSFCSAIYRPKTQIKAKITPIFVTCRTAIAKLDRGQKTSNNSKNLIPKESLFRLLETFEASENLKLWIAMINRRQQQIMCTFSRDKLLSMLNCIPDWTICNQLYFTTVFENHRKCLIQHCQRSELHLHFEWTIVNQKC